MWKCSGAKALAKMVRILIGVVADVPLDRCLMSAILAVSS